MTMPSYWAPESTRKGIIRMASILAPVAARAESHFTTVKVRCLTRHSADTVRLAMVAEGSAEDFRRAAPASPEESLEKTFRTIWWDTALKSEGDAATGAALPTSEKP